MGLRLPPPSYALLCASGQKTLLHLLFFSPTPQTNPFQ